MAEKEKELKGRNRAAAGKVPAGPVGNQRSQQGGGERVARTDHLFWHCTRVCMSSLSTHPVIGGKSQITGEERGKRKARVSFLACLLLDPMLTTHRDS
jgi:hypothetical protein